LYRHPAFPVVSAAGLIYRYYRCRFSDVLHLFCYVVCCTVSWLPTALRITSIRYGSGKLCPVLYRHPAFPVCVCSRCYLPVPSAPVFKRFEFLLLCRLLYGLLGTSCTLNHLNPVWE
jgi:hypothetical protein